MAYVYVPDQLPPQSMGPYQPQVQPIYIPTPPLPPGNTNPTKKGGKGLSVKRVRAISDEWLKVLEEVEAAKKGKRAPEKDKRKGLNWVELTLFLVFVSPIVTGLEVGIAISVVHLIGK